MDLEVEREYETADVLVYIWVRADMTRFEKEGLITSIT